MSTESASLPRAAVVVLAAGSGRRLGSETNKVFLPLEGRTVVGWSLQSACVVPAVTRIVLVVAERDRALASALLASEIVAYDVTLVVGGETRHDSEWNALQSLAGDIADGSIDVVVIHDGARPLADSASFAEAIAVAHARGGAIPVRPQAALIAADHDSVPPQPDHIVAVQTPQAFRAQPLLDAYRLAAAEGFTGTDTASCIERYGDVEIAAVDGSATNIKITYAEDLILAERLFATLQASAGHTAGHRADQGD